LLPLKTTSDVFEGRLHRRTAGQPKPKEHHVQKNQNQQGQQGNNAAQGGNKQQSQSGGNQGQQGGQNSKLTPSGGSSQQSQSGGGRDQQGSNIKSDQGQAQPRNQQQGSDHGNRSDKQR
jgi:hypothetical protein